MKTIDYYGLTIEYRIENKNGGEYPTAVIRLPRNDGKKDVISQMMLDMRIPDDERDDLDAAVKHLVPAFLRRLDEKVEKYRRNTGERIELRSARELPLAALWEIDRAGMKEANRWTDASLKEYDKDMAVAIRHWGHYTTDKLTPNMCHEILLKLSAHQMNNIIRGIKLLYRYEAQRRPHVSDAWEKYKIQSKKTAVSPERSIRAHIEERSFPNKTLSQLLQFCAENINQADGYLYFGLMLMLTMPLSWEELCALRHDDFESLPYYDDYTMVRITKEYRREGRKNYKLCKIKDPYRVRVLPLTSYVQDAYRRLTNNGTHDKTHPLIHHPHNRVRYWAAGEYETWVKRTLSENRGKIFGEDDVSVKDFNRTVKMTLKQVASVAGFETDEIDYFFGHRQKSVAGGYYTDFGNSAEINRLRALLDRWLDNVVPWHEPSDPTGNIQFHRRGENITLYPQMGCWGDLTFSMKIPHSDEQDRYIDLYFTSPYGMDITAKYVSGSAKGDA